ncbi:MAG: type II toxin-antitoxin system HipA family toxin [Gammaproteobacteria bacterium]
MPDTAYVYIYLPGQTDPTVAARFDWEAAVTPNVGELVYAESYLANKDAVPLDPIALPLRAQVFTTTLSSGFFGALRDAIPDDWGRQVARRLYGDAFRTDFDYLWMRTADRVGALAFGANPRSSVEERPLLTWKQIEQSPLLEAIRSIDRDLPLTPAQEEVALAFGAGTTVGGARPKLTVLKDGCLYLAKLNRHSDRFNVVRLECAMLDLAAACGISVPEHDVQRVHDQDILLVKRFDRAVTAEGVHRHRVVSAATVFQANEAVARYSYTGSYPRLARELLRWTITGQQDRRELFRRVAFNALTSVTDDHERNHALVAEGAHFRLSPAFDLVPQPGNTQRRYLALAVGDFGALAARQNLISSVEAFQLSVAEANDIIDEVQNVVRTSWRQRCSARGASEGDIARVEGCFDSAFFESELAPDAVM